MLLSSDQLQSLLLFRLERRGYSVFFDKDDLPAGTTYDDQILSAIRDSNLFIFLISPSALNAGRYTMTELRFAREKWNNPSNYVLPVMIVDTELAAVPEYLKAVTILNPVGNVAAEVGAAVDRLLRKPPPSHAHMPGLVRDISGRLQRNTRRGWPTWLVAIIAGVALVAGVAMGFIPERLARLKIEQELADAKVEIDRLKSVAETCPTVTIADPSQDASVLSSFSASGGSTKVADGKSLWLVVQPVGQSRWWPQGAVVPRPDGKWLQGAHLGGQKGQRFEIQVVCTSPTAHQAFDKYLKDLEKDPKPGALGFPALPQGAVVVATVEVRLTN